MNKKGASHADWAISLGIFLVYTLVLFIVIQPGVEPVFKESNLLQIVRIRFENDTSFKLEKTVMFVNISAADTPTPTGTFRVTVPIIGQFEQDFYVQRVTVPAGANDFSMVFFPDTMQLDFEDASLGPPGSNYSEYEIYHAANTYPTPTDPGAGIVLPDETYDFGPTEVLEGVHKNVISPTDPLTVTFPCTTLAEYQALKAEWNFPAAKDFAIYVVQGSSPLYNINENVSVCSIARPFEQASVFIDEYPTWILDEFGNRYPIRVNIRVW